MTLTKCKAQAKSLITKEFLVTFCLASIVILIMVSCLVFKAIPPSKAIKYVIDDVWKER